jgi:small subunit ribosomal protein S20
VAPGASPIGPARGLCYHPGARGSGRFHAMPNIRQQEKRVRSAARQRLENLRYRSTIKTLARRLETAVADGDADEVERRHRELMRTIDRAAARGAIHRNAAARKKSQAAQIVSAR